MQTFWHDLALAIRLLRKSPGFAVAAVATLALGIGANATIFSFADALLLRPLRVPEANRIVHVYERRSGSTGAYPLSYADYADYRSQARSFEALAAHYDTSPMHLVIDGDPQAINGAVVTWTYFDLLKVQPAVGRFFGVEEDTVPDRDAVVVISHGLWERQFGSTPAILGEAIRLNDRAFTVIGVAPRGFTGVHNGGSTIDAWIPTAMFAVGYRYCDGFDRDCTIVNMLGKLRPGVSIRQAQQELDILVRQLDAVYPRIDQERGLTVVAARGRGYSLVQAPGDVQQLQLFVPAVAVVLLVACANIAGLLLARAIRRRKEMAVRLALGATRGRLVRQLLTESLLLAALGGGGGLLFAFWGKDLLAAFNLADYAGRPRDFQTDLRGPVLVATAAVTTMASVLFGVIPALQASRTDVIPVLKDEGMSDGSRRTRLRRALVVAQMALAVMLVVCAGLLVRSLSRVNAGPGFDPRPVITLRLRPSLVDYSTGTSVAFQREVISRLEALPGVVSASPADGPAATSLAGAGDETAIVPAEGGRREYAITMRQTRIGPRYFATLGVPMVEGREFDDRDDARSPRVVIVNDVLARRLGPLGHASGRTLVVDGMPHQIVGVVKDAQYYPAGQSPHAVVYKSYWQPDARGRLGNDSRTIVRVTGDAGAMMTMIRREVAAVDPAVPISEDYPLSRRIEFEFQPVRVARALLVSVGALALFLSAIGLYGVLAFNVSKRTREIGIRMALGAGKRDVAVLVLREALATAVAGSVLGIMLAWAAAQSMGALLYGVRRHDPGSLLLAPVILILVAVVASYLPARRASRVSPQTALRYE
jgi:predicted permease